MTQTSTPQYASVEQPFGAPHPKMHCPICGQMINDTETNGISICPHLTFVYIDDIAEFSYTSPEFEKKLSEEKSEKEIPLQDRLRAMRYGNHLLVIEITYGGLACGPIWYTNAYGFDYNQVNLNQP